MKLIFNDICNSVHHDKTASFASAILCVFTSVLFSLSLLSCREDVLSPDNNGSSSITGQINLINLPGVYGISIQEINNSGVDSRGDNSTVAIDGNSFADGSVSEYDLINTELQEDKNTEFYHYLLLYNSSDANSKPLIFPIDATQNVRDNNPYNLLTLTITKVLTTEGNSELNNNDVFHNITSKARFAEVISGYKPYVLLNFKLIDGDNRNYSIDSEHDAPITVPEVTNSSTAQKLSTLTRAALEKLQMRNFRISAKKAIPNGSGTYNSNYFTMTSSVYSNGSVRIVDGTLKSENIFSTEEEAKAHPGLTVYVERLASKITVDFDIKKMAQVEFGFVDSSEGSYSDTKSENDNYLKNNTPELAAEPVKVEYDNTTGLPVIHLKVRRVNMDNGTGIKFDDSGYTILTTPMDATIRILGFGVSNLEMQENLFKYVKNTYDPTWNWRDVNNHRCYWAEDSHYDLEGPSGVFTKAKGYPHQYRLALDTDSVTSYHAGKYTGAASVEYQLDYEDNNALKYINYTSLGAPTNETISGVYLKYKSYNDLAREFKTIGFVSVPNGFEFDPIYALENTYVDQGMLSELNWRWPWQREPYAAATNLMLLASIEIDDNPYKGDLDTEVANDLYLGQNSIFYLKLENLLKSKLEIFNKVMLSGGNAGFQILHGQWDRHSRWDEDDKNQYKDTHLDKVGWNEGSYLWFAETEVYPQGDPHEGMPIYDKKEIEDEEGNKVITYKVKLKEGGSIRLNVDDNITDYLTLIPAEISGGDGQRLIAPTEPYMGVNYRYYLAPVKKDDNGNEILDENKKPVMDEGKAVEISFNHLVALIHKIIGPVDVYRGGRMYYSVPIPHRDLSFDPDANTRAWTRIGSFGIVRNNWYSITVDKISRLGTPVDDADQPIVPVMDVKRSYINMGVKLKDWHQLKQDNIPVM